MMASLASAVRIGADWADIRARDCPLVIEQRPLPFDPALLASLLSRGEFELRLEGAPASLTGRMRGMPEPLIRDAVVLAERFAHFMAVPAVRLRLERIDRDACRKVHSDYTDVRLLCTYAGPGTDYFDDSTGISAAGRMDPGWVGLFKGRSFAKDHPPAFHRSPPIILTGERRLLLVIDTPLSPAIASS